MWKIPKLLEVNLVMDRYFVVGKRYHSITIDLQIMIMIQSEPNLINFDLVAKSLVSIVRLSRLPIPSK